MATWGAKLKPPQAFAGHTSHASIAPKYQLKDRSITVKVTIYLKSPSNVVNKRASICNFWKDTRVTRHSRDTPRIHVHPAENRGFLKMIKKSPKINGLFWKCKFLRQFSYGRALLWLCDSTLHILKKFFKIDAPAYKMLGDMYPKFSLIFMGGVVLSDFSRGKYEVAWSGSSACTHVLVYAHLCEWIVLSVCVCMCVCVCVYLFACACMRVYAPLPILEIFFLMIGG